MRLLYVIADFFYLLLYYVIGYRKKVVFANLKMAYPEKDEKELKQIMRRFFRHFIDLIFESIKAFTISEKQLKKRYTYKNIELINEVAKSGKSIILSGAHYANWELSFALPSYVNIECNGTYTKLQNPYFEKAIKKTRMRFGYDGVHTSLFTKHLEKRQAEGLQSLYILLSDQSPRLRKTRYWTEFFNVKVPVHTGIEVLAKKYDFAVINMNVTKVKRGYFNVEFELLTDDAKSFKDFELTDKYLKATEAHVAKDPAYYLWSHKRFKHKDKYDEWLTKYKR